jgi:hypothetical protein
VAEWLRTPATRLRTRDDSLKGLPDGLEPSSVGDSRLPDVTRGRSASPAATRLGVPIRHKLELLLVWEPASIATGLI